MAVGRVPLRDRGGRPCHPWNSIAALQGMECNRAPLIIRTGEAIKAQHIVFGMKSHIMISHLSRVSVFTAFVASALSLYTMEALIRYPISAPLVKSIQFVPNITPGNPFGACMLSGALALVREIFNRFLSRGGNVSLYLLRNHGKSVPNSLILLSWTDR